MQQAGTVCKGAGGSRLFFCLRRFSPDNVPYLWGVSNTIGKWKTIEWEEVATFKSNPVSTNGTEQKIHTVVYNKIPAKLDRMDLEAMIQKLDRIRTLPVDHLVYPALKRLKQLRNRVHLQMNTDDYDHDYNCFSYKERDEMRSILWQILTIPVFCKNPSVYDFIKPEKEVSLEESGD